MATTRKSTSKTTAKRSRKVDDSLAARTGRTIRERPYVSAAIATGAVTAVAAAAAGAFFFSRRDWSSDGSDSLTSRVKDGVAEATSKAKEMAGRWMGGDDKDQSDIAEEALTLKSTGKSAKHPVDPVVEQQTKAGAVAY